MTPKDKAKELVDRFLSIEGADDCGNSYSYVAKQCALICVDEIQEHAQMIETKYERYNNPYQYFLQVKHEISLL